MPSRGAMANGDGMGVPSHGTPQFDPEQTAYWHAVISDLDDAVIRYTPDLVCRWCNASYGRLIGHSPEELINRNVGEFLDPSLVAIAKERVQTLLTLGS